MSEMLRKHTRALVVNGPLDFATLGTQMQLYPALAEFLFRTVWEEDGSSRVPGTALIFGDGAWVKVMLNDKDQGLVAFTTLEAQEDILGEIDAAILSTSTDWRKAKVFGSRK